ncbi:MAG: hypothetical protein ACI8T1_003664 [Verrucomicrobiales bacterium]|jgi:hypothetical protein
MDGFWFVFVRLRVTAEPETIQPISNKKWGTAVYRPKIVSAQVIPDLMAPSMDAVPP